MNDTADLVSRPLWAEVEYCEDIPWGLLALAEQLDVSAEDIDPDQDYAGWDGFDEDYLSDLYDELHHGGW